MSRPRGVEGSVEVLLDEMIRKEKSYTSPLQQTNESVQAIAQTLAHDGTLQDLLEESKLSEYRDSVKRLAIQNVESNRQVQAYVHALQKVKEANAQHNDAPVDYSKILQEAIDDAKSELSENSVEIRQESMYLKVVEQLNEPNANAADEDVAILPSQGAGASLKCPLTAMLMTDPYRNKLCGHTYEHEAILQHLRKDRQGKCPVTGCGTQNITPEQLEKDTRVANLIRREKARQKHACDIQLATQDTIEMDEEDDE